MRLPEKGKVLKKEKFKVTGMSCSACSSRVEKVVGKLDGVKTVSVNLLTGTMQVEFDDAVTDEEKIRYKYWLKHKLLPWVNPADKPYYPWGVQ